MKQIQFWKKKDFNNGFIYIKNIPMGKHPDISRIFHSSYISLSIWTVTDKCLSTVINIAENW